MIAPDRQPRAGERELAPGNTWRRLVAAGRRALARLSATLAGHPRTVAASVLLAVVAAGGFVASALLPAWRLLERFERAGAASPSRLYARGPSLAVGDPATAGDVVAQLVAAGYREGGEPLAAGRFARGGRVLRIHLRRFPTAAGELPGGLAQLVFAERTLAGITLDGQRRAALELDPPLLHAFVGADREDRRPVRLAALPDHVVRAVLAAEDDGFYRHPGVSLAGIARAAAVNLRHGEVRQGGSTITQQLVKTLLRSPERSLGRKAREALLALVLEARYSKRRILEAYLNEAYLGVRDGVSLLGIGAAARGYFGVAAEELTPAEAATLAGMLGSPGRLSPLANPSGAQERRDHVLDRMAALGWLARDEVERAKAEPIAVTALGPAPGRAPFAVHVAAREAAERFGAADLERGGWVLLSTLDWRDQRAAEDAVTRSLAGAAAGGGRRQTAALEAALVSLDPRDGALRAWVGGRDFRRSQFDRAGSARRQAGSAFKPVVYAAALARGVVTPASLVADEPIAVEFAGQTWTPRDDDGAFLGAMTVRAALEQSRNLPAVRVALDTGLPRIVALGRALGIDSELEAVPALALGAFAVTPVELATVYATFAAGGIRPQPHLLAAVLDAGGAPRAGEPAAGQPALDPAVAHVITTLLQGVVDRGSGAAVRSFGLADPVAGKTGTSNEGRDAWFAGYSPDRVTVVWVGRDDDAPAGLHGSRVALPVWARFAVAVRPHGGYPAFVEPAGVVTALIDPQTGGLATAACPRVEREVFLAAHLPAELCPEHRGFFTPPLAQPEGVPVKRPGALRRFFQRLFGRRPPVTV